MICLVAVGNPLRCDDAVGAYIVSQVEDRQLSGVKVIIVQQLQLELLEEILEYDQVILVDAAVTGKDLDFYPLKESNTRALASSHHINAQLFSTIAQKLYGKEMIIQICSVKGEDFSVGDKISPRVLTCADQAVELICSFVKALNKQAGG